MSQAVKEINEALNNNSEEALTLALSNRAARLSGVVGENGSWYMKMLEEKRKIKQEVHFINFYLIGGFMPTSLFTFLLICAQKKTC